jgi:hypothetical protein
MPSPHTHTHTHTERERERERPFSFWASWVVSCDGFQKKEEENSEVELPIAAFFDLRAKWE